MICEFCNATMDERKIYGVLTKDSIIVTCSRCYPVISKNQKTNKKAIVEKTAGDLYVENLNRRVKRNKEILQQILETEGYNSTLDVIEKHEDPRAAAAVIEAFIDDIESYK